MTELPINVTQTERPMSPRADHQQTLETDSMPRNNSSQNEELLTWLVSHSLEDFEAGPPAIGLYGYGRLDAKELVNQRLKRRDELDARIAIQRELVALSTDNQLARARGELALVLYQRYSDFGGSDLLQESIALFKDLLDLGTDLDLEQRACLLNGLGDSLCSRFKEGTEASDIEQSLAAYESCLQLPNSSTRTRVDSLLGLGIAKFWSTYFMTGSSSQVGWEHETAIEILEHALTLASSASSLAVHCRLYLTLHLFAYQHYKPCRVYRPSICIGNEVSSAGDNAFVSVALMWCWYCYKLQDIDFAKDCLLVAHVLSYVLHRSGHPEHDVCWLVLSALPEYTAPLTGSQLSWFLEPLHALRPLLNTCRPRSIFFQPLNIRYSYLLNSAYAITGHLAYLEETIMVLSRLDLQGALSKPLLNNLCSAVYNRFRVLGNIADLRKSTELLERCVPPREMSISRCTYATNLGACYIELSRSSSQGDITLVDKAIDLHKACVQVAPGYHLLTGHLLEALCERFRLQRDVSDLETGITAAKAALAHQPETFDIKKLISPALAEVKRHLGIALRDITYLQSALRGYIHSTASLSCEHPDYADSLGEQAVTRAHLWRMSRKDLHFYACVAMFRQLMQNSYSRPNSRLAFGQHWINVCTEFGAAKFIAESYNEVLKLLPRAIPLDWSAQGRLISLKEFPQIAIGAALHFLMEEDVARAIERLEGGRALLWSRSLLLREDFSGVPSQIKERVYLLAQSLQQTVYDESAVLKRRQQSEEFDSLVDSIRRFPGLQNFMQPATYSQLCEATSEGPVLILLGNDKESFAIIAPSQTSNPFALPLPNTNKAKVIKLASTINSVSISARDRLGRDGDEGRKMISLRIEKARTGDMETSLAELWTAVMWPIVQCLGLEYGKQRPRLWILPVGSFALLPLHAAGIYSGTHSNCLSDYCIPSYIPSMQALLKARLNAPPPTVRQATFMMIAEPEAPSLPPLLNAVQEIESVSCLLPSTAHVTSIVGGTKLDDVTQHLARASIVHLACHGQQDRTEPLQSGFMLGDGKLTVANLMSLQMPNASIALLSACESAMGDKSLPDEAIHLSATMLFIGFRSVVGTLWSMHDVDGPQVMKRIYEELLKADEEATYDVIPRALEAAVRELREAGAPASRWATYIHMGI